MAKIHNPQDQHGNQLIDETVFNTEIASLREAVSNEVTRAKGEENNIRTVLNTEIDNRINSVEEERNRATAKEGEIDNEINKLKGDLLAESERSKTVETQISLILTNNIDELKAKDTDIDNNIENTIAQINEINDHITDINGNIDTINGNIDTINGKIESANGLISENTISLSSLGEQTTELKGQITALDTKITGETASRESEVIRLENALAEEKSRAKAEEENILNATLIYDGTFGNWNTPSDRRDKANCYYFKLVSSKTGYIKSLKIQCRPEGAATPNNTNTFIKITKEDDTVLGQSINALPHTVNAISIYEFDKSILIEAGTLYKFMFITENGNEVSSCVATTKTASGGATPEELFGGGIHGAHAIDCQAIFEITLLNQAQVDSEKLRVVDSLPTEADVNNIIADNLKLYSTTVEINDKLDEYQLKSEMPAVPVIYKFNRDKNVEMHFTESDEKLEDVVKLTLNNGGKIITSNAVADNNLSVSQNVEENVLTLSVSVNKPTENTNTYIIIDAICDSEACDNAQHICHVVPVSISI